MNDGSKLLECVLFSGIVCLKSKHAFGMTRDLVQLSLQDLGVACKNSSVPWKINECKPKVYVLTMRMKEGVGKQGEEGRNKWKSMEKE